MLPEQIWVWNKLSKLLRLGIPWFVVGCFNAIVSKMEHKGWSFDHYAAKSNILNDSICFNNLFDLGFPGPSFTWCNRQSGCARRWADLDGFLANLDWLGFFASYSILYL